MLCCGVLCKGNISLTHRSQGIRPSYIIVGKVSKEVFNLPDKRVEMAKFWWKVHEYLYELYKLVINFSKTKETEPTMI